jgi:hypothetical protein
MDDLEVMMNFRSTIRRDGFIKEIAGDKNDHLTIQKQLNEKTVEGITANWSFKSIEILNEKEITFTKLSTTDSIKKSALTSQMASF